MKYFLIVFLALFSCKTNTKATIDWISESAISLTSIDPLGANTQDLQALKDAIGASRVVLLGEAEHGDGSTFLLKSRVVKYLHQELGFRVIAFEGTFYGLNKSWEDYANKKGSFEVVKDNLYVMWKKSKQCEELFKYIEQESKAERPFILTGIDSRQVEELEIATKIDSILNKNNLTKDPDEHAFFMQTLTDVLKLEYNHKIPSEAQNRFLKILKRYEQDLVNTNTDNFWIQELRNTRGYVLHSWRSAIDESKGLYNGSFRDQQMADNLIWLINEKYKGEKIIVWAANSHVVKNFSKIDSIYYGQDEIRNRGAEHSIGEYLENQGIDIYSIITLYYSGKGSDFNFQNYSYENAEDGSLEKKLHERGFKYAFLDIKSKEASMEQEVLRSGLPGYVAVDLKATCDGIFFIDEMNPNTRIEEF